MKILEAKLKRGLKIHKQFVKDTATTMVHAIQAEAEDNDQDLEEETPQDEDETPLDENETNYQGKCHNVIIIKSCFLYDNVENKDETLKKEENKKLFEMSKTISDVDTSVDSLITVMNELAEV